MIRLISARPPRLPFQRPEIRFSDITYWIRHGATTKDLRRALQEHWGQRHVHVVKSTRQALWLIFEGMAAPADAEVLVCAFTPPVVPLAVIKAGFKPVFCDVVERGFVMSLADSARKVTPRTVALIMPYTFGCSSDREGFRRLAEAHDLVLIEDCAQTFDGYYENAPLGFAADFGVWSFGK